MSESSTPAATTRDTPPERDVLMAPMPPGSWQLLLGLIIAALAPLGGFLAGSMAGPGAPTDRFSPLFLYLFGGIVLGGVGIVIAGLGGLRFYRHRATSTSMP